MKTNNQIRETGKHGQRDPVLSAFLKKQENRPYGRYESVYCEPQQICVR